MRAVWSFWSKPFLAAKGRTWKTQFHHLLSWGLSLRLARKHYPETVLVTDRAGKSLLVDHLGLSFAHVSTELDRLRHADPSFWALGKLVAYSIQDQPFLHLDTDVFLWTRLPSSMEQAPVFAQCPEQHSIDQHYSPRTIECLFDRHQLSLPAEWEWSRSRWERHFREENCGILGGVNTAFLRDYATTALSLIMSPSHACAWAQIHEKDGFNQILEQFWLSACLDYHRFMPDSEYPGLYVRHLFPSLDVALRPGQAERTGFTHLLGDAKQSAFVTKRLEDRMLHEDPDLYRQCARLGQNDHSHAWSLS
ncbi:MAG: hypothetical protein IRZ03_16915 [Acidobacterium ailaaui]|nr:hypothetical protein [Pseudacidobacterium ailaaui]